MINKKRLAMIAVAASMVLPTNLAYLSVITPVFATELSVADNDGKITLSENTDLTTTREISTDTEIDLGGHTLTINVPGETVDGKTVYPAGIKVTNGATLTIKGTGTITSTSNEAIHVNGASTLIMEGSAKDSIAITARNGVGVDKDAKDSNVELKNVKITGSMYGIYNNGEIQDGSSIKLDTVTINSFGAGIYQAGPSTIEVKDCTIIADLGAGIETRAGTLTVTGGTIESKGTKKDSSTQAFTVEKNSGGPTGYSVGILIAQHVTEENINVTIDGAILKGDAALGITNPEGNEISDEEIKVNVKDATLSGTTYDVAYSDNTIPFTLENTATPTKLAKVTIEANGSVTETEETEDIPYTIINTEISSDTVEAIATGEVGEELVKVSLGEDTSLELPLKYLKDGGVIKALTATTLANALTAKSEEEGAEGDTIVPKYTYVITENAGFTANAEDGISLSDASTSISVKLANDSKIKLTTQMTQDDEVDPAVNGNLDGGAGDDESAQFEDAVAILDDESNDPAVGVDDESKADPVTEYVPLSAFNNDASEESINEYLETNNLGDYKVDVSSLPDKGLNTTTPLQISGEDRDVELDENGFIVVQLNPKEDNDEEDNSGNGGTTVTPSRPSGNKKPKPEQPSEEPVIGTPTSMYRLYNKLTGEHLYTIDKNERDNLLTSDTWKDEGEGWIAPSVSDYPVYRLLNPNNGDHHYTTDKNEFDTLPSYGWVAEGVAFFSADKDNSENVLLHRLYNPNATGAGSHHYTADTNERDALVEKGWKYEGLAWAGLPANK